MGSFSEKAKNFNRVSLSMPSESTCFLLQYDPSLTSVAVFLDRVILFGKTLGDKVKGRSPKRLESLIEVHNVVHENVRVLRLNMILISSQ